MTVVNSDAVVKQFWVEPGIFHFMVDMKVEVAPTKRFDVAYNEVVDLSRKAIELFGSRSLLKKLRCKSDPTLEMLDETYTAGRKADIAERRRFGWLTAHTSNTVGRDYLRITMIEPRSQTEWNWQEMARGGIGKADETHVGIRLHVGQVRRLRRFLDQWLEYHYGRED